MDKDTSSWLYSGNASFIEDLYESYLADPGSVAGEWRQYFDDLQKNAAVSGMDVPHGPVRKAFLNISSRQAAPATITSRDSPSVDHQKQVSVLQLINAYRFLGHRQADLDPLKQYERPDVPELDPAFHGLTEEDLDKT